MANPLATVKSKFGDKKKLVAEVEKFTKDENLWLGRTNEDKGLAHVSNAKLLKLHATFAAVKEKFGSRAKLIDAICELEKRKDEGYKTRLGAYPVPRLFDMYSSIVKKNAPKADKAKRKKAAAAAPKKKVAVQAPKKSANATKSAAAKAKAKASK